MSLLVENGRDGPVFLNAFAFFNFSFVFLHSCIHLVFAFQGSHSPVPNLLHVPVFALLCGIFCCIPKTYVCSTWSLVSQHSGHRIYLVLCVYTWVAGRVGKTRMLVGSGNLAFSILMAKFLST